MMSTHNIKVVGLTPRISLASSVPWRMSWNGKYQAYMATLVRVRSGKLDKAVFPRLMTTTIISNGIKSALAEHSTHSSRRILLNNASILDKKSRRRERLARDETEMELSRCNRKREDRISLSRSWKPLIHSQK
jgi:hypothetical protein